MSEQQIYPVAITLKTGKVVNMDGSVEKLAELLGTITGESLKFARTAEGRRCCAYTDELRSHINHLFDEAPREVLEELVSVLLNELNYVAFGGRRGDNTSEWEENPS